MFSQDSRNILIQKGLIQFQNYSYSFDLKTAKSTVSSEKKVTQF